MQLLNVNIGREQAIQYGKASGVTGIYKHSTNEPVQITRDGLAGDAISDKQNHGGDDQAVYIYGSPDYAWWSKTLGHEIAPGTFGENLTISDLESAALQVGDRLHVGEVTLEITAARIPCVTLAARMGDPQFVKRFRAAERPGAYCRVIQTGTVHAGETVRLEPYAGETISVVEMFRLWYDSDASEADIRRVLAAPLAIRARAANEERLERLLADEA